MRIFGREPALIIGFVGAAVTVLVSGNVGLSAGAGAALTTLVSGVLIAAATRPWKPALFAGLVASAAALVAEFGYAVPDQIVTGVSALILATFALFVRAQVTPVADPRPASVV